MIESVVVGLAGIILAGFLAMFQVRAEAARSREFRKCRLAPTFRDWVRSQNLSCDESCYAKLELLLQVIGECYNVPPTSICVSDRFFHELGVNSSLTLGDDSFDSLQERVEESFNMKWSREWLSVADLIKAVC